MFYNLITPINNLGYGIAGFNIAKTMFELGFNVGLFVIGQGAVDEPQHKELIETMVRNGHMYNPDAPCLRIYHQFSMDMFVGKGPRIGFPIFELDTFTDREKHHLQSLDAIFVCSKWAKEVVEHNGIDTPTFVVPLGTDRSIFYPEPQQRTDKTTRFLNIGKWEIRKGHDILLEAFNSVFEPNDDVELWLVCDNPFIGSKNDEWKNKFLQSKMGHRIRLVPRLQTQRHLAKVMNLVDCGVFPTRAEGWCLPALDMMSCGKPVIITNYSGQTEFVNKENAMMVDSIGFKKAEDGVWFHGQGNWGWPDVAQLHYHMRQVHLAKQSGINMYNSAGAATASKFSWTNTVKNIVESCDKIGFVQGGV